MISKVAQWLSSGKFKSQDLIDDMTSVESVVTDMETKRDNGWFNVPGNVNIQRNVYTEEGESGTHIPIGLTYIPPHDNLNVYDPYGSLMMKDIHYSVSAPYTHIDLVGWSVLADESITFEVSKNTGVVETSTDVITRLAVVEVDHAKHKTEWINAVTYGFKNDGATNNDTIMAAYLASDSSKVLYFPNGTYNFASHINFASDMLLMLDKGAELKLVSSTVIDCFIAYHENNASYGYKSFIKGGTINGNNKCKTLVGLSSFRRLTLQNFTFKNFTEKGIVTRHTMASGGELTATDGFIINETLSLGTTGIYDNGSDNEFNNIIVQDIETAIYTNSGHFRTIHYWLSFQGLIPTSCFAKINSSNTIFIDCVCDTSRRMFYTTAQYLETRSLGCSFLWNSNVYTADYFTNYPPICFGGIDGTSIYHSNQMHVAGSCNFSLCEFESKSQPIFDTVISAEGSRTITNNLSMNFKKLTITTGDLNNKIVAGSYEVIPSVSGNVTNLPAGAWEYGQLIINVNPQIVTQMYVPILSPTKIYVRYWVTAGWSSWKLVGVVDTCTTAGRPTLGLVAGYSVFDTTLGKPIWRNAANSGWVDATGTAV